MPGGGAITPSGLEDSQDCVIWPTQRGPGLGLGMASRRSSSPSGSTTTLGDHEKNEHTHPSKQGFTEWEEVNDDSVDEDEEIGYLGLLDQYGKPIPDPKDPSMEDGNDVRKEKENDRPMLTSNDCNKARWPPVTALVKNVVHLEFVKAIIMAVDDCGCQHSTQAKDKVEPKANRWMKLVDVCYGGMAQGRGKLARFGFKPITKATDMKKKVLSIWREAVKQPDGTVDKNMKQMCEIQLQQYTNACEKEVADRNKGKEADLKLQREMADYQRGKGAKPPGAVGIKGGGRVQHSTNTRLGEPASFQFANASITTPKAQVMPPLVPPTIQRVSTNISPAVSSISAQTPSNRTGSSRSTAGRSTPRNSGSVNSDAMDRINAACSSFEKIADKLVFSSVDKSSQKPTAIKPNRLERLQLKLKALKDSADFYEKKGPQYADKLKATMDKYEKVNDKLMEELAGDSDSE
jgi:hypothetical protein